MPLPDLPKKLNRREADIQHAVATKLREKHRHRNWILEVKVKGGRQKAHQKTVQKQVENGKFLYKFADMGREMPGDYLCLDDADYILCTEDRSRNVTCLVNGGVIEYRFRI